MNTPRAIFAFFILTLSAGPAPAADTAGEPPAWQLRASAQVDSAGVFLDQLVANAPAGLARIQLAPAPAAGKATTFSRDQIDALLRQHQPDALTTNWGGAQKTVVSRRMRQLEETELKQLLTDALQRGFVKDRGELELHLTRPWTPAPIVDEPLELTVADLPTTGVTPNFIVRVEARSGGETVGRWQLPVQARIWCNVWVAAATVQRGQLVREADLVQERRDILTLRDPLMALDRNDSSLELAEYITSGTPLRSRSVRQRPIIHRGRLADALVQQGTMTLTVKVEALEDGLPGQVIRVRNVKSKREFRGKVQNEETVVVSL